jgi:hypothetical protein
MLGAIEIGRSPVSSALNDVSERKQTNSMGHIF